MVNAILSSRVPQLFVKSASEVVFEGGEKTLVSGPKEQKGLPNVYTFQRVICIVRWETISAIPSLQDYRDKIKLEWILHSSDQEVFTKAKLFEALFNRANN